MPLNEARKAHMRQYYRDWVANPYERPCKDCQKPTVAFGYRCDTCRNARKTAARKRCRDYVRRVREDTPCADCGQGFPWYVMEFDHPAGRNGSLPMSRIAHGRSMAMLQAEIAKCEVVCGNCHNIRTHMRAVKAGTRK